MPDEIEALRAEVARLTRGQKMLGEAIHNMVVAQQSAWIEWRHGGGAEAAMIWIHNGLAGPGHIPDEDAPYGKEAQAWYDANNANPMPKCHCGRPSNIGWLGGGACSEAHYREAKAAQDSAAAATSMKTDNTEGGTDGVRMGEGKPLCPTPTHGEKPGVT